MLVIFLGMVTSMREKRKMVMMAQILGLSRIHGANLCVAQIVFIMMPGTVAADLN